MAEALPRTLYLYRQQDGCFYWRVAAPCQMLFARGYPVLWMNIEDDRAEVIARQSEVVVMTRFGYQPGDWLGGLRWLAQRRAQGNTLIYETDDDIFSDAFLAQARVMAPDRPAALLREDARYRRKTLQACDGVVVSTPRLATLIRSYTDRPVLVVPNAIDWEGFRGPWAQTRPPFAREHGAVVIGWAGGKREAGDLLPLAAAWRRIAARYPETCFVVAGWLAPCLLEAVPRERLAACDWLPVAVYPRAYAGWDIGCAPLEDKPFNHMKSTCKILEYGAAEAAVVASPTVYGGTLRDGRDGLIAETADEWEAALARLVEDAALRRRLVRAWGRRVEREFSLAGQLARWPAAWQAIREAARAVPA
jgi:glycosyltransferase involved in cell wall biosynthesis